MKCQSCGENEATVHWTEIGEDASKVERHLCEACAQSQNVPVKKPMSLSGILQQLLQQKMAQEFGKTAKAACPSCGMSFIEFRSSGRLGCPNDYEVFSEALQPMLERLQDGVRHCGKVPESAGRDLKKQNALVRLRRELERAVQREDYEKAAEIRDRIKQTGEERPEVN